MRRPWCAASVAAIVRGEKKASATKGTFFSRREAVAQKRQVYENVDQNDRHEKGVKGCWAVYMPENTREQRGIKNG